MYLLLLNTILFLELACISLMIKVKLLIWWMKVNEEINLIGRQALCSVYCEVYIEGKEFKLKRIPGKRKGKEEKEGKGMERILAKLLVAKRPHDAVGEI